MELLRIIVRAISYVYQGVLSAFLFGISFLAIVTNSHTLQLDMLPWTGKTLSYCVLFGSLFGLVSVARAVLGKGRFLFFIWSLAVVLFLVKGCIFSGYVVPPGGLGGIVAIGLGALVSLVGAWFHLQKKTQTRGAY